MAYDEIQPCPDCGKFAYDRCPCGWSRPEGSSLYFWVFVAVIGLVFAASKLAM